MPENSLKAHLLFHLTQSLPSDDGPTSTDIPPALVVFRAVRRTDQPQHISLLQEALSRRVQLYALLATSVDGTDLLLCAYVTLLTMSDSPSAFDVSQPPDKVQLATLFFDTLRRLLSTGRSLDVLQTLELFSETSLVVAFVRFFRAVELFAFRRAEAVLPTISSKLRGPSPLDDDLLGPIPLDLAQRTWFSLLNELSQRCASRSPTHVFRFLQLLSDAPTPAELNNRVALARVIAAQPNFS